MYYYELYHIASSDTDQFSVAATISNSDNINLAGSHEVQLIKLAASVQNKEKVAFVHEGAKSGNMNFAKLKTGEFVGSIVYYRNVSLRYDASAS